MSMVVVGSGGSANLSMSRDQLRSNFDSVQEQTEKNAVENNFLSATKNEKLMKALNDQRKIKPLPAIQGKIAPAFGEPGGGIQILPNMQERVNVEWLLKNNYIREVR